MTQHVSILVFFLSNQIKNCHGSFVLIALTDIFDIITFCIKGQLFDRQDANTFS